MTTASPPASNPDSAAARAEAARRRAGELQDRRQELASGSPVNAETAERARLHAEESLQRAASASRRGGGVHQDAAVAHRALAELHDAADMQQEDKAD